MTKKDKLLKDYYKIKQEFNELDIDELLKEDE